MDLEKIEDIIKILESSKTEELIVRKGDTSVSLKKMQKSMMKPSKKIDSKKTSKKADQDVDSIEAITAPMVGLFHKGTEPIKVGDRISVGQVVGSIESMKLVNDVISKFDGVVKEVLIEDGYPVEYGQHLFHLEKSKEA